MGLKEKEKKKNREKGLTLEDFCQDMGFELRFSLE